MNQISAKDFRSLKDFDHFESPNLQYYLLPFRFHKINQEKEVLVNEVGDFLITPLGTSTKIAQKKISRNDPLYADLVANYFISEQPLPSLIDVLATRYRTKKSFLENFTALHIFVISLRCNHSCHYCQVSRVTENRHDFDVSFANLKAGVDHMFKSPSPSITMEFQGGEPLLAFDKVKFAVEYALELNKSFHKEITIVICTNSTVFNNDILDFCETYNILISTSLDGPPFIHNANRPKTGQDSYSQVVEGIKLAREALGFDKVSALMTTTSLSLNYPKEIIDNFIENGFNSIFLRPISPYGFALKNTGKNFYETEMFLEFYKKGLEYIIKLNQKGQFFKEEFTSIVLKKILTPFSTNYVDLQSPSGMINSVIVFNYDGFVYATDESRMIAENGDFTFRLGHVSDDYHKLFYGEKSHYFSQFWSNESLAGCSDCGFQTFCGADPVFNYATQGDLAGYRPTSDFCLKNMEIFRYIFDLMDKNGPEVLPIFYSWLLNEPTSEHGYDSIKN